MRDIEDALSTAGNHGAAEEIRRIIDTAKSTAPLSRMTGNNCAILVQGDEGPAQVVRLGIGALHRFTQRRWCHLLAACP
jgi:hypothetical protein